MKLAHSVAVNDGVKVLVVSIEKYHGRVARLVTVAVLQDLVSSSGPENLSQPRRWIFRKIRYLRSVLDTTNIDNNCSPVVSFDLRQIFVVYLLSWGFFQCLANRFVF